jgi:hypothetical protein
MWTAESTEALTQWPLCPPSKSDKPRMQGCCRRSADLDTHLTRRQWSCTRVCSTGERGQQFAYRDDLRTDTFVELQQVDCQSFWIEPLNGPSCVEMVRVDVRSGAHRNLLAARAPDTKYDTPFNCPVILDPLAAVGLSNQPYFLLNWETQTSLVSRVE